MITRFRRCLYCSTILFLFCSFGASVWFFCYEIGYFCWYHILNIYLLFSFFVCCKLLLLVTKAMAVALFVIILKEPLLFTFSCCLWPRRWQWPCLAPSPSSPAWWIPQWTCCLELLFGLPPGQSKIPIPTSTHLVCPYCILLHAWVCLGRNCVFQPFIVHTGNTCIPFSSHPTVRYCRCRN